LGRRTLIEVLREKGVRVVSVGKPSDMVNVPFDETIKVTDANALVPELRDKFAHAEKADTNPLTGQGVLNALDQANANGKDSFIFANFVDTDSLWGHTRDIAGSLRCVMMVDRMLPLFEAKLKAGDLLMITADHGMEHRPDTAAGAGYGYHHREHTPLLVERIGSNDLGGLKTGQTPGMTQIGDLVAQMYGCHEEFQQVIHSIEA
jgi:phosphopentomutase